MTLTLERTIPLIFTLALVFLALMGGLTYRSLINTQQALEWEKHTREVQLQLEKMQSALVQTETNARGYVLLGREDFVQRFNTAAAVFHEQLRQLDILTTDNPLQQERLKTLQGLGEQKLAASQKFIDLRRTEGAARASAEVETGVGVRLMDEIRPIANELEAEEFRLLNERKAQFQTSVEKTIGIILAGSLFGILSLAIANGVIVRQLNRRRKAEAALAEANARLEKRVEEQSEDLSKTSDELRLENIRRALAEKKEREQREWWRVTLNSIGDCVITTDTDGKINYINQVAQEVTEWGVEEAQGLPLEKVFNIVNEQTLQSVESPITKVLRDGVTVGLANHTSLITKSGRYLPIDDSGAPIRDDEGNIIGAVLVFRDFTPQRERELQLRRVEEMQRLALESGRMGIFAWNLSTNEVEMDSRARALFGKENDERVNSVDSFLAVIHADDRPALDQSLKEALENGKLYDARFRVQLPDKTIRWVAGIGQVETNVQGVATFLRGINYDVTEQVEAEEKLRESEQFSRSVFENSPDCVKILELDGRLHSMNTNGLCLMEIEDFSSYVGRQWVDFWPEEYREAAYQAVQSAAQNKSANFQGLCRTAKGTLKWWDVSVAPILNAEGKPVRLISTSRDITDRKEQENALRINEIRFRTLTETIPQLVWTCRPTGECGYLSNRWMAYTGTTLEQNLGYGWLQAVHPDDAARTQEIWQEAVATSNVYQTEFRLRRADGVYRWHLARAVRVDDEMGSPVKWFGTCTDIEDHKRAEAERMEMLEREQVLRSKAEEANRLKDEFVATVSHELRTPLNAILGWARMIRAGTLDAATARKAIDVIERSAENQARLIDDLLDMSRIITGKLRLDIKTLDPSTFVRAAIEAVMPTAKAKDISIQADINPYVSAISGDPNRLQQVVWNLLSNAIKFTPKGGEIQVRLTQEQSQLMLMVRDNGQGIDPEFLPYVFDRFRQADGGTIRKHGGLGLGLSIVRHLVELHGGVITVESEGQHKGAAFTIRLPILPIPINNFPATADGGLHIAQPALNSEAVLQGLLILVVDDEPDARQLLAQILTAYGATVTTTDSADSALEIIKQQQPDLLVSDIGMPNSDGYSLIRRVREYEQGRGQRLPAIALTAYARPKDRMQALAAGFNHHVPKPVEPAELVTVIASLTGRLELSED